MKRTVCIHLGSAVLALFLLLLPRYASGSGTTYSALLLNSYHSSFPWTDGISRGIRSTFEARGLRVNLDVEYMDTKRTMSARSAAAFAEYFRANTPESVPTYSSAPTTTPLCLCSATAGSSFPAFPWSSAD